MPSSVPAQHPDMKEKSIHKNTSSEHMDQNTYEHMHTIMEKVAFIS